MIVRLAREQDFPGLLGVASVERFGPVRFADELAAAGVSAVLLPDLAVDRAGVWLAAARSAGLHTVNMVWPHSDIDDLARVCAASGGMVYAPATMGTTGTQGPLDPNLSAFVARVRTVTSLPIGVGIGIGVSTPQQAAHVSAFADAVIVGSALIRGMHTAIDTGRDPAMAAGDVAREFADAVHRGIRTPYGPGN
ncbi:tryptophan synthase subunit alpha [Yinghuangia sp. ASG 101]|uniref:tryptophan synthase subunit alpha n=1 Tax=Yinghuangia sp. ASG 101 TaxID=2896848 RepID=UPI001E3462AF|nr:tryptophan synthase subunit alpha [Yinghuangia sp. ASG 101]UGQ11468.1 tryptophan synthase subunit alpha [Yinghuangia sp. ASG 101]